MVLPSVTSNEERISRSFSATESDHISLGSKLSRTWSANSIASGEASNILKSWDVIHNESKSPCQSFSFSTRKLRWQDSSREEGGALGRTESGITRDAKSIIEAVSKEGKTNAKFDASAVRKINKTYKKVASGLHQKESFLQKLLTRKTTRRLSRTSRLRRTHGSSGFGRETASSSEEEPLFNTLSKPNSALIIHSLAPFIPKLLRDSIAQAYSRTSEGVRALHDLFEPDMSVIRGAVMVVDVSGFTRLTEQLGKQGNAGIELLTLVINNYLSKAIEIVEEHGGDVIKFAGDSLIVAFYSEVDLCTHEEFKKVVLRSLQCAEDLSRNLGKVQMSQNGDILPQMKAPPPSRMKSTFAWIHESRIGRSNMNLSVRSCQSKKTPPTFRKSLELSQNSTQIIKRTAPVDQSSEALSPIASHLASVPSKELESVPDINKDSELLAISPGPQQRSACDYLFTLLCFVTRRKQQEQDQDEADLNQDREGSSRLSPRTPDKSDRLLHRGSTFWRESLTSKRSSATSVFRNVLEEEGMSLKVLVGCGDYCMFRVGGFTDKDSTVVQQDVQWEYIIADKPNEDIVEIFGLPFRQPLTQIAAVESFAKEGDVIVSQEILQIADQGFEYETLEGAARITGQMFRPKSKLHNKETVSALTSIPSKQRKRCIEVLRTHVPQSIRPKLEAGHLEYISEVRTLSVMFFGFPGLTSPDKTKAQSPLKNVQITMETLQRWMKEFEGSFVQFRCDEKGFLAICAFGLSGSNHVNNSCRAIAAAFKIINHLTRVGIETCVGITSGDLLCACIGSKTRAEYTLFGNAVNLSARLMCKAKKGMGTILCDASTQQRANRKAHYHPVEEVKLKGLENPILIYLVTPLRNRKLRHASEAAGPMISLVGRQMILEGIVKRGKQVLGNEEGGAIIVKGQAGIGKTKLVTEFQISLYREVPSSLKSVFYTVGDADSKSLPLYSWRRIFENMFTCDREHSVGNGLHSHGTQLGSVLASNIPKYNSIWRGFLAAALEIELEDMPCSETLQSFSTSDSEMLEHPFRDLDKETKQDSSTMFFTSTSVEKLPTTSVEKLPTTDLDPVVWHINPCASNKETTGNQSFQPESLTRDQSSNRRRSTFELNTLNRRQVILDYLVLICQSFIDLYGPMILLFENMHHMDTLSWELANSVVENINRGLLLVMTIRPHEGCLAPETLRIKGKKAVFEKSSFEFQKLCQFSNTEVIELKPFDVQTTKELIYIIAEGSAVSDSVVQYIYAKSNGIPLYVEQMTKYLQEQQLLESVILGGALNSNEGLMSFIRDQVTIHQMLLDKIDQLRPITHLTLKVASVIGKNITAELLEAVYPLVVDRKSIKKSLKELVDAGFLLEDKESAIWMFRSMLDRDSVNEFVPQSQRRLLHAKVAAVLSSETSLKVPSTTIAYHWSQSCFGCELLEKEKVLKAVEWWQKSANEAYEKLAFVEALRLYQKAMDYANYLDSSTGRARNKRTSKVFGWIKSVKVSRTLKSKKIHDSQVVQITPSLKARWERRMAQLCITVAPQATSPELRTSVLEEATFHALEALQYLGIPSPHFMKLHKKSGFYRLYGPLKRFFSLYQINECDSKRRDEISQLLDVVIESSPTHKNYVDEVKKLKSLDDIAS